MNTNNKGNIELVINLDSPKDVKELIQQTESGMYSTTSESGENVVVYIQQNEGVDIHFYQKNGWIRIDEYDIDGYKISESFNGRWNK